MTIPQLSLKPRHIDCQPPKTRRRGSAIALNPPHSAAQTTASQKGYLKKRVRPPVSRSGHPRSELVLKVRNQKKTRRQALQACASKALKAWLTGMKSLENTLFSLPLQGKFDVSPRANALQGTPSRVFGTGPAGLAPGNLKFRHPQGVHPETSLRGAVKTSVLQLCTSSRRVRKASRPSRVIWHLDLQSMPHK